MLTTPAIAPEALNRLQAAYQAVRRPTQDLFPIQHPLAPGYGPGYGKVQRGMAPRFIGPPVGVVPPGPLGGPRYLGPPVHRGRGPRYLGPPLVQGAAPPRFLGPPIPATPAPYTSPILVGQMLKLLAKSTGIK